jgi:hypothetical protein
MAAGTRVESETGAKSQTNAARTLAKALESAKIGTTAAGKTTAEGCDVVSATKIRRN